MADRTTLTIDVVMDVVCPWCFLGKRRLDGALAQLPDLDVTVRFRPFQLDPTIPPQGVDRDRHLGAKFGSLDRLRAAHVQLTELGAADGIRFDFDQIRVMPNTLDAHRVVRWAGEADLAAEMTEALYTAYFTKGSDIGDPAILAQIAEDVGLDGAEVRRWLATDADRAVVSAEVAEAGRIGITGVPCLVIENKYAVTGAQETATLVDALQQIAEEKAFGPKA